MNTIFIWGAPVVREERYVILTKKITAYFKKHSMEEAVVFYPKDLMKWDLGKEMAVYISGPNIINDSAARQDLAITIGTMIQVAFNCKKVSCSVLDEPRGNGYWSLV